MSEKFDVFVGNLTFNTTEEQLREKFSFVGPVKNIRILTDKETGKPKGFAFVEYYDANTALSAIRHLDQTDLNSRKIKVGYPSQSNLKDVARQIGQVVPESSADVILGGSGSSGVGSGSVPTSFASRSQIEQSVINSLKLHEAWDILEAVKKLVAEDNNKGHKAKVVLETHPQLISALYEIQKRLGIPLPKHVQKQQQQAASSGLSKHSDASIALTDVRNSATSGPGGRDESSGNWDLNRDRSSRDAVDRGDQQHYQQQQDGGGSGNIRASSSRHHVGDYHNSPYGVATGSSSSSINTGLKGPLLSRQPQQLFKHRHYVPQQQPQQRQDYYGNNMEISEYGGDAGSSGGDLIDRFTSPVYHSSSGATAVAAISAVQSGSERRSRFGTAVVQEDASLASFTFTAQQQHPQQQNERNSSSSSINPYMLGMGIGGSATTRGGGGGGNLYSSNNTNDSQSMLLYHNEDNRMVNNNNNNMNNDDEDFHNSMDAYLSGGSVPKMMQ